MTPSTSRKVVLQFIYLIHYHRNVWAVLSHTLGVSTEIKTQ